MSDCFPHFFCDRCSNVIHRDYDQYLVWYDATQKLLDEISGTLPECPCGGRFAPGGGPKCRRCGAEFENQDDPIRRLHDPFMFVVDGACVFSDGGKLYRVKIRE
ncbi:MAG TPA: hypothetical protein VGN57_00370 [Pirellulaceae bacterium]|jgi:hypothetical protein|nr:hypothetical protein [Pirellulaceae bacterium]